MKKILGLDLGTNSIGWALIEQDFDNKEGKILGLGSRIIPTDAEITSRFNSGLPLSKANAGQAYTPAGKRTDFRGIRRLKERFILRRERLHRVLNIMNFLPEHYSKSIDFEKRYGKFFIDNETKLVYKNNPDSKKPEFIFKHSFDEMLADFKQYQSNLLINKNGKPALIPYDWTIYYLRKKALKDKIEKEELAWILLNFNQKRGYYQLRGEEDEDETKTALTRIYFVNEKIINIKNTNQEYKGLKIFQIKLSNGEIGKYYNKIEPNWLGIIKNIIVTVDTDKKGNDRLEEDGSIRRKFTIPTDEDWEKKWKLIKIKTEKEINDCGKTVGCYIYDTLLQNPNQKIKGKLVRTIERNYYEKELRLILEKQKEFHPELNDKNLYITCIQELYKNNEPHQRNIKSKDFTYLFLDDIIFYQRPLKSKKSLISNCRYESKSYTDKDGNIKTEPVKCIPISHPIFQEFRLLLFIQNLKIYQRKKENDGKILIDTNITSEILKTDEDYVKLYKWLNDRKEIDQKSFLKYFKEFKLNDDEYRWNYVEDNSYPANETRSQILSRILKIENGSSVFLTKEIEEKLWHILYSVQDKKEIEKALNRFASKHNFGEDFKANFKNFPPFKKEYASYSAKAIKKLLPLMRFEKYWKEEEIDSNTKNRINKIINGEVDEKINEQVREKAMHLNDIKDFKGLPLWLACYIVYNRYSEEGEIINWNNPKDIEDYLRYSFKQHSLRNPIVEQVITETLRVVSDIWKHFGKGEENFFNEIHIELGREIKNTAINRKKITSQISENENTNLRIKALLSELINHKEIENVRPYSPNQHELLKIYEEGVLNAAIEIPDDILKISKIAQPSKSELIRYKLWLEQKYRSPYTGEIIPLNKLFTTNYEIEHIIPQSRYFDDSLSNKVICETEVNKDKDKCTAYEYIQSNHGKKIELNFGKEVTLFSVEGYENFVKTNYANNKAKLKKLLMDDIPDDFIKRQLNDTRYISKVVKSLLSNIVREKNEEETTSKNLIPVTGTITSVLKQDWGLNDVWNEIITPRFERLNSLTNSNNFGKLTNKEGKNVFQIQIPPELSKGFNKKRVDHRHHAMDALVIASATKNHVNYLNNEFAKSETKRFDLRTKLCFKKKNSINDSNYKWIFSKPWGNFTQQAKEELSKTIISFKQNTRVINKTTNWYQKWVKDENGLIKKNYVKQDKGDNWAIRKPLHKETVSGLVNLRFEKTVPLSNALDNWDMIIDQSLKNKIKELISQDHDKKKILKFFKDQGLKWNEKDISKTKIYYFDIDNTATRKKIDNSFNSKSIKNITDTGIQKILFNHLYKYNVEDENGVITEHPELAFSNDGIDDLNNNIVKLNNGKFHQSIFKVRYFEQKGNKFIIGTKGNKKEKYVEAAKGTNLFFAIYKNDNGKRIYDTIPLNVVIERQKQGLSSVPEINENGDILLFHISPNDLVFIPNEEDLENKHNIEFTSLSDEKYSRIYKIVSFTGNRLYAIPNTVSTTIFDKFEFTQLNKLEFTLDKKSIKEFCWKLFVDRLGNIIGALKK